MGEQDPVTLITFILCFIWLLAKMVKEVVEEGKNEVR